MVIEINLLPWRELKRKREQKQLSVVILVVLISVITILLLFNNLAKNLSDKQIQRNQRLTEEIVLFTSQIEEKKKLKKQEKMLITRLNYLQNLQKKPILLVHLFDELVKLMPDGVYLNQVQKIDDSITLKGIADSNSSVSKLIQGIEKNPWLQSPILGEIKKTKPTEDNEFILNFILKPKKTALLSS